MIKYNQTEINENLTQTFLLSENNPTLVVPNTITTTVPKIKGKRGGARPGTGRKLGQKQKLSALTILAAIEDRDKPFAEGFAEDYHAARMGDDKHLLQKYQSMILNKVVADKQEIDHTTLGQSLHNNFIFPTKELPDWKDIPISFAVNEK